MFAPPPFEQQVAIVATASETPSLNQPAVGSGTQPDAADFLHTIGEQERISKVRDQDQLISILQDPKTNDAIAGTVLKQLIRYSDVRAADALYTCAVDVRRNDSSRLHAFSGLATLALENPELRSKFGEAIHKILIDPAQPEGVRTSAGFYAIILGHPDAKPVVQDALTNPKAPISMRLLAATTDPVAGAAVLSEIVNNPKATPAEHAQALVQQAVMDPAKVQAIHDLVLTKSTSIELRYALLAHTSQRPGLLPNSALAAIAADADFAVIERNRAISILSGRAGPEDAPALRKVLGIYEDASAQGAIFSALSRLALKEDRPLMVELLSSAHNNEYAFAYFAATEPQTALDAARKALEKPSSATVANNFEYAAVRTLATLGNEQDMQQVIERYGELAKERWFGNPGEGILNALATGGHREVLDKIAAKYGENGIAISLARTQAGSDAAVEYLLSFMPDRERSDVIISALVQSEAPAATQYVFRDLGERNTAHRRIVDAQLSDPGVFARFVDHLKTLGGESSAYADTLIKAKAQGIEHPARFRPQDLSHIVETRLSQTGPQLGEKQALMVVPRSDWNGAFNNLAKTVADLRNQGYRIVLFEASNEAEVVDALKSNSRYGASDLLVLAAHGSPKSMSFGGLDPGKDFEADEAMLIDLSDRAELITAEVRAALKEGGRVVLESCSTGAPTADNQNLVRFFREVFPQAAELGISGPVQPSIINGIMFDEKGQFKKSDWGWVEPLFVQSEQTSTWQQFA